MKFKTALPLIAGTVVLFASSAAMADPPSRVGRVSYAYGDVSTHTPDQDDWYSATVNVPVTTGDAFWTERDARLEIQIGGAEIRLDHNTELDVTQLDDEATVLEVPEGVVSIHVRHMPDEGIEILTPQGETEITEPGTYHIDTGHPRGHRPADRDYIAVLDGRARFASGRRSVVIREGDMAVVAGYPPSISMEEADTDEFDDWAEQRNRHFRISHAHHYVSPMVTGYEDLDTYGHWDRDPQYGQIWYPDSIPADWAPYRYGHWAYISPWGWTWVDDQPWGFAPFHYGRWVRHRDRWAWYPGVVEERPVYAPALVAFIGGRNFGISLSLGNSQPVGWVPLAPDEPFRPYYDVSDRYRVAVNRTTVNQTIINNTVINNRTIVNNYASAATSSRLANREAATVIPATAFVKGSHVKNSTVQVSQAAITQAAIAPPETVAKLQPTVEAKAGGESKPGRVARQANRPETSDVARERMREVRQQHRAERDSARMQRMNQRPGNNDAGQLVQPGAPASASIMGNVTSTNSTSDNSANSAVQTAPVAAPVDQSQQIQSDRPFDTRHRGRHEHQQQEDINSGASAADQATQANPEDNSKGLSGEDRRSRRFERMHGGRPEFDRQAPADNQESISAGNSTNLDEQSAASRDTDRRHRGPHEIQNDASSKPNSQEITSPSGENRGLTEEKQNPASDGSAKNSAEQSSPTGAAVEQSRQIQSDNPLDERHGGRHEHPQSQDNNSVASPAKQATEPSHPEVNGKEEERASRERRHGDHPEFDRQAPPDNQQSANAGNPDNPNEQSSTDRDVGRHRGPHDLPNNESSGANKEVVGSPNGNDQQNTENAAAPQPINQPSPHDADAQGGSTAEQKIDQQKGREENKDASSGRHNNGRVTHDQAQEQGADDQTDSEKRRHHKKRSVEGEPDSEAPQLNGQQPASDNQSP